MMNSDSIPRGSAFSKRSRYAWMLCASMGLAACGGGNGGGGDGSTGTSLDGVEYMDITGLSDRMSKGTSSHAITAHLLDRIARLDQQGPALKAVIELNPDALRLADQMDAERASGKLRGPLHGIPVLMKDNIDTGDRMQTTAGSLAMVGAPAARDAFVAKKLREAGAIILGKTNLSEWAHFRDASLPSGWSGRGGQTRNPYVLNRDPCGSSSGSGVGVAAGFSPIALGTETDGSILCPAAFNGVVGLRPTLGLASRTGIIPISAEQDTPGPMARSVRDAALLLSVMAGADAEDSATREAGGHSTDFTRFLKTDGLAGRRVGYPQDRTPGDASNFGQALAAMGAAGAVLVPVQMPNPSDVYEVPLLAANFGKGLTAYLATRRGLAVRSLQDLIAFNRKAPLNDRGLPYPQGLIELAADLLADPETEAELASLGPQQKSGARAAIDGVLQAHGLDVLASDQYGGYGGAMAGYPAIVVPSGLDRAGMPLAVQFLGTQWSEPVLLGAAYAFEQTTRARRNPQFLR
jgi:amidase